MQYTAINVMLSVATCTTNKLMVVASYTGLYELWHSETWYKYLYPLGDFSSANSPVPENAKEAYC